MTDGTRLEDRYVAAVLASIPDAHRTDVEAELRASIADATEARVELGDDPERVRVQVLEGLGDPGVLAAELTGRPLHLIGPRSYLPWLRLLKVLLAIVVPIVVVAVVGLGVAGGDGLVDIVASAIGAGAGSALQIVFWVTLVFAVLERTGETSHLAAWSVDDLPESRDGSISLGETVWSVASLVAVIALLVGVAPGATATVAGDRIAVFAPGVWDVWIPVLVGLLAVEAIFEIVKYRTGRWTTRLAVVNLVVNAAFAALASWLLLSGRLLDPELVTALEAQLGESRSWLDTSILITTLVVIGVSAWSALDGFLKARRTR